MTFRQKATKHRSQTGCLRGSISRFLRKSFRLTSALLTRDWLAYLLSENNHHWLRLDYHAASGSHSASTVYCRGFATETLYRFANFPREACVRACFRFGMEAFATRVLFIDETSQRITLYSIPQLGHLNFVTLLTPSGNTTTNAD